MGSEPLMTNKPEFSPTEQRRLIVERESKALDMLDDEFQHSRCPKCTSPIVLGIPYHSLCNKTVISFVEWNIDKPPTNGACPECLEKYKKLEYCNDCLEAMQNG